MALAGKPAKPKTQAARKSPLLLEARLAERVAIYDADNPLSNTLDLAFFVENVSTQPLDVFDLTVILTFHDGETQTIDFEAPGVLDPTFGSVYFPLLVLPEDAATGGATALVVARYEDAAGNVRTRQVELRFAMVNRL